MNLLIRVMLNFEFITVTQKTKNEFCVSGEARKAEEDAAAREKWLAEREERLKREAEEREIRRQEKLKEMEIKEVSDTFYQVRYRGRI